MYVRKVVEYIFWRMRVVSCRSQAEIMEREDFTQETLEERGRFETTVSII